MDRPVLDCLHIKIKKRIDGVFHMFTFFNTTAQQEAAFRAKSAQVQDQKSPVLTAANDDKYHQKYFAEEAEEQTTTA